MEAARFKQTELFEGCNNIVGGIIDRKVYNDIPPGRYEDGNCEFWKKVI